MGADWFFPSSEGVKLDGFMDGDMQHFEGDREFFLARETIQNSIDARLDPKSPVIVEFRKSQLKASEIPGFDRLQQILTACERYNKDTGDEEGIKFFKRAARKRAEIPCLFISDFNTTGLCGDDEDRGSQWFRLTKTAGSSKAEGPEGGTFGIGKAAPFVSSGMRALFYSTVAEDTKRPALMGKAILTSFDEGTDTKRGEGLFGVKKGRNVCGIREQTQIPSVFVRNEVGTTLAILDYEFQENWRGRLIQSVLRNFFMALHLNELVVRFVDEKATEEISARTLAKWMEQADEETREYYQAITKPVDGGPFEGELAHIGPVRLYVARGAGYSRHIVVMRKPHMYVDSWRKTVLDDFAAVFVCDNNEGNRILKQLEPPKHDEWDSERGEKKGIPGHEIIRSIHQWIRETLKKLIETEFKESEDMPDAFHWLEDAEASEPGDKSKRPEEVQSSVAETADERLKPQEWKRLETGRLHGSRIPMPVGRGERGKGRGRKGKRAAGLGGNKLLPAPVGVRWVPDSATADSAVLIIRPSHDVVTDVELTAIGVDSEYAVELISAVDAQSGKSFRAIDNRIAQVDFEKGKPKKLKIRLREPARFVLGVKFNVS